MTLEWTIKLQRKERQEEGKYLVLCKQPFLFGRILYWIYLLLFHFSDILSVWPSKSSPETDEWQQSSTESYQD